jgi:hypothetical protein
MDNKKTKQRMKRGREGAKAGLTGGEGKRARLDEVSGPQRDLFSELPDLVVYQLVRFAPPSLRSLFLSSFFIFIFIFIFPLF